MKILHGISTKKSTNNGSKYLKKPAGGKRLMLMGSLVYFSESR